MTRFPEPVEAAEAAEAAEAQAVEPVPVPVPEAAEAVAVVVRSILSLGSGATRASPKLKEMARARGKATLKEMATGSAPAIHR